MTGGQTHFAKNLTKLKRRTATIAHVNQNVENPKELLRDILR
jgi:ribosomal protein L13E